MSEEGGGASRSTDPAAGTSAATDVSLREYLMREIQASRAECREGLRHLEAMVSQAETNSSENVEKALASIDKRFDSVNEFRDALSDLGKTMATKSDVTNLADKVTAADEALESRFEALYQRNRGDIDLLNKRMDLGQGAIEGSRLTKSGLYTVVGLGVAFLVFVIAAANYLAGH